MKRLLIAVLLAVASVAAAEEDATACLEITDGLRRSGAESELHDQVRNRCDAWVTVYYCRTERDGVYEACGDLAGHYFTAWQLLGPEGHERAVWDLLHLGKGYHYAACFRESEHTRIEVSAEEGTYECVD